MFVLTVSLLVFLQTGTVKSTSGNGVTTTTRFPVWRAREHRSAEGSEVADVEEEEAGDEAGVGEVCVILFYFFFCTERNKSKTLKPPVFCPKDVWGRELSFLGLYVAIVLFLCFLKQYWLTKVLVWISPQCCLSLSPLETFLSSTSFTYQCNKCARMCHCDSNINKWQYIQTETE